MNKKILLLSVLSLAALSVTACGGKKGDSSSGSGSSSSSIPFDPVEKDYKGTGTLFKEYLGFNTKDAAVIEENGERYVVYASNEQYQAEQVFAARKATKTDGIWVYGDKKIVLRGNSSSWDKNIYNPSIMKGTFSYGGTAYSYLMAYNGNSNNSDLNNHIGLAVTNDILGEWTRVGSAPVVSNPENQEAAYGLGSPSLVSYDSLGKGYLFYSVGEIDVSYAAVKTFDFSNLDSLKIESGFATIPVKGLNDAQDTNVIVNAGFGISADKSTLYMVKDRLPQSSNKPNQSVAVEVAKAPISIIQNHNIEWESIEIINSFKTMDVDDEESLGWDEIYSGEFVSNEFGYIALDNIEVVYSTFDEESSDVNHSSTLASYLVNINA